MTENFIQLKKRNTLKIGIKDYEGNDTGEFLEFDLNDINLPLKYQDIIEKSKKNKKNFDNEYRIINQRKNIKGNKMMSKNDEDKIRLFNKYFEKESQLYNEFLGENGVKKLLNGRPLGWDSLLDIRNMIEETIMPLLEKNMDKVLENIKEKYNYKNENKVLKKDE